LPELPRHKLSAFHWADLADFMIDKRKSLEVKLCSRCGEPAAIWRRASAGDWKSRDDPTTEIVCNRCCLEQVFSEAKTLWVFKD
jgi:hypothetical protein